MESKARAFEQWVRMTKKYFLRKEEEAMNRAQDSGASVADTQSWKRATIPMASPCIIRELFWQHIKGGVKRNSDYEIWRKSFYDLEEFKAFYRAITGKPPRISAVVSGKRLVTFVAPYGYVYKSCSKEKLNSLGYDGYMREEGMKALEFNCEAEGAEQLPATGAAAKTFRVFILERKQATINSKKVIFYKVLYPDEQARTFAFLMQDVRLKGLVGWVLNVNVTQAYARLPTVSFKAKPFECQAFTYMFKPFQAKDGCLQWRVSNLPVAVAGDMCIPPNYSLWNGDSSDLNIEEAKLLEHDIMFHFCDAWYHVRVVAFYPPSLRTAAKPFNYEVLFIDGTKEKIDIMFDLNKYSSDTDAPVSSWCIIIEA